MRVFGDQIIPKKSNNRAANWNMGSENSVYVGVDIRTPRGSD